MARGDFNLSYGLDMIGILYPPLSNCHVAISLIQIWNQSTLIAFLTLNLYAPSFSISSSPSSSGARWGLECDLGSLNRNVDPLRGSLGPGYVEIEIFNNRLNKDLLLITDPDEVPVISNKEWNLKIPSRPDHRIDFGAGELQCELVLPND